MDTPTGTLRITGGTFASIPGIPVMSRVVAALKVWASHPKHTYGRMLHRVDLHEPDLPSHHCMHLLQFACSRVGALCLAEIPANPTFACISESCDVVAPAPLRVPRAQSFNAVGESPLSELSGVIATLGHPTAAPAPPTLATRTARSITVGPTPHIQVHASLMRFSYHAPRAQCCSPEHVLNL
jgi:hypothetical protein